MKENNNLQFLNETVPCGFLKYTCEPQPKLIYINEQMRKFLGFDEIKDGEVDYFELFRQNIFLMIPMEERGRFSRYLNRVYEEGGPVAGEMSVLRCDGRKAHLFGWVVKCKNEDGTEEFQSVCMDITERYVEKRKKESDRYIKAIAEVYDKIFEYNLASHTVKCLYGQSSDRFRWIQDVEMNMYEATNQWICGTVVPEEQPKVQAFFEAFCQRRLPEKEGRPPQITYRAISSDGTVHNYVGLFLKLDSAVSLYCCRKATSAVEADSLRSENVSLRSMNENMQEMMMRFTDGIAAFEIVGNYVKPLYASDNVCEFFGFTKEEWLPMMKQSTSIKLFVSRCGVDYEDFMELLQTGEAEFTYLDLTTNKMRRIKAICSQKFEEPDSPRYVMLYKLNDKGKEQNVLTDGQQTVYIRTFGYFDVFVNDKPIAFRNKKSKELFALLVDRRGGYVTSEEAISFLWEEELVNSVTLARYRKVALRLKNILEEYGISDIVEAVDGKRRIVTEKVQCDLFDYLTGKEEYGQLFKGSYLTNYSWGETTLGELISENL